MHDHKNPARNARNPHCASGAPTTNGVACIWMHRSGSDSQAAKKCHDSRVARRSRSISPAGMARAVSAEGEYVTGETALVTEIPHRHAPGDPCHLASAMNDGMAAVRDSRRCRRGLTKRWACSIGMAICLRICNFGVTQAGFSDGDGRNGKNSVASHRSKHYHDASFVRETGRFRNPGHELRRVDASPAQAADDTGERDMR